MNNGNISISVYYKNNNSWVGNYSCLSGEGWTVSLPAGYYFVIFDTEYAEFKAINRTIKVIPDVQFYANVTPVTTNYRIVNITAKSNIPQDIVEGQLLFILPNGDEINANYSADGTWWAVHIFADYGDYLVNASYIGLNNVTINDATISIIRANSTVNAPDVVKYFGGSERFAVTVTDNKGNPLENKTVTSLINGVAYSKSTKADGTVSFPINLNSGVYYVLTAVDNVTVDSIVTVKSTVNATDLVKVFGNAAQFSATFRDSQGNYLPEGTKIRFNINGVMYERTVRADGIARLNINLEQGTYVITSMNTVTGENAANNVTVIPRIVENSDLTKYYRNASQYTVKLVGDDGKAVGKGEVVTFNINGIFYNRTTDDEGIARLNINLQPGDYIITAEYKGCRVSNNIKVLPVLSAKDLTKKYGTPDQFVATLVDGQGNPFAGQEVTFNINGVFYNRTTDANGQAKLNIKLQAGEYIITSSYAGMNIANRITVTA